MAFRVGYYETTGPSTRGWSHLDDYPLLQARRTGETEPGPNGGHRHWVQIGPWGNAGERRPKGSAYGETRGGWNGKRKRKRKSSRE